MTFYFDPVYGTPAGDARASWYGFTATPSVMLDGQHDFIGGLSSGSMYSYYNGTVMSQHALGSPLVMDTSYSMDFDEVTVTADISVDQAMAGTNTEVFFFVCQDGLKDHPNMVVDKLANEPFSLTTPGQQVSIVRTFTMDEDWDQFDLNIIVLVQNTLSKQIYQAAQAVPDYEALVAVDASPDGLSAPWHLVGPGVDVLGNGDISLQTFAAGEYVLTWLPVLHWTPPAVNPVNLTVAVDGTITFDGAYSGGPFSPSTSGPLGNTGTSQAVSLIDFNEDGHLDAHVVNEAGADQLLQNDGTGNFTDVAAGPIADAGAGRGAAWADINQDGHLDVYLSKNNQANVLLAGDGAGGFAVLPSFGADNAGPGMSASWVDFDVDGDLDIYLVNNGADNQLFKSFGDNGTNFFVFGTETGPFVNNGDGNAACWFDGDLDGRQDLFLVNYGQPNLVLHNTDFAFVDLGVSLGMDDLGNGVGAAWGDFDNDGFLDCYVANDGKADVVYRGTGNFQFVGVVGPNIGDKGTARGVTWADFDNDTNLDVYVARHGQIDLLLFGDGFGGFVNVPVGVQESGGNSNACAAGDLNDDGRVDVFITRLGQSDVVMDNNFDNGNSWLKVKLNGSGQNTYAIGARLVLTAAGVTQTRMITSGSGYLSGNALETHFGLAQASTTSQLDIYWPDGTHQVVGPVAANQTLVVTKGAGVAAVDDDTTLPRVTKLGQASPNPFNPYTTIDFALADRSAVRLEIYSLDGRVVRTLRNEVLDQGTHQATWHGSDDAGRPVSSGTYFYRLTTDGGFQGVGRMSLVK